MDKLPYQEPAFALCWQRWLDFRNEIKRPYKSKQSESLQLKWFIDKKLTCDQAIEAIEQSIRSGWQGIFEVKKNMNASNESSNQARKGGRNQGTIDFFNETAAEYAARNGRDSGGKI